MIETSAHLVDHGFPEVPVRQWVLSFTWPLRLVEDSEQPWLDLEPSDTLDQLNAAAIR